MAVTLSGFVLVGVASAFAKGGDDPEVFNPPFNGNQGWTLNMRLIKTLRINLHDGPHGIVKKGDCKFQIIDDHTLNLQQPSEYDSGGLVYPGTARVMKGATGAYGEFQYVIEVEDHLDKSLNQTAIVPWLRGNGVVTNCAPKALIATGYFAKLDTPVYRKTDTQGSIIGDMPTRDMAQLLTNAVVPASKELIEEVAASRKDMEADAANKSEGMFQVSDPAGSDAAKDLAAGKSRDR